MSAGEQPQPDHLDRAADLVLAVVTAREPAYPATPEAHDAMVDLLESIVSALLVGRTR